MRGEHWFIVVLFAITGLTGYYWYSGARIGGGKPSTATSTAEPSAAPAPRPAPVPRPGAKPGAAPSPADEEQVAASHILIQYQGSKRSKATRTKEEAKALAEKIRTEAASPGADFPALAAKYSEEPNADSRKGNLGRFSRSRMVKPFADAAFSMKVGEVSQIVETEFGFHVIKRTE